MDDESMGLSEVGSFSLIFVEFLGEDQQVYPVHSDVLAVDFFEIFNHIFAVFGQHLSQVSLLEKSRIFSPHFKQRSHHHVVLDQIFHLLLFGSLLVQSRKKSPLVTSERNTGWLLPIPRRRQPWKFEVKVGNGFGVVYIVVVNVFTFADVVVAFLRERGCMIFFFVKEHAFGFPEMSQGLLPALFGL